MAIVRAIATGNWSNPAIWNTGALPTAADDVYSNTFTVTIDVSPTVLSISNAATTGVTAGGGFQITANNITLTCTGTGISAGGTTTTCLIINLTVGQTCNVIGNVAAGTFSNGSSWGISISNSGTVNITGNVRSGDTSITHGINAAPGSSATLNITGNVQAGIGANTYGVLVNSNSIATIVGQCFAAANAVNTNNFAVFAVNNAVITVIGALQSSNTAGVVGMNSMTSAFILTGPFLTSSNGTSPIWAWRWFWANSNVTPTYYQIRTANLATIRPLYTADSVGGNPAVSNVRSGTIYGPNNELTGTCAVPPAGSVALGVPVDNTTGTAVLTQENFQAALTAQGLTTARAANLDNLDAAVSSRLPTTGYTAPPSATTNASAVRTELSTELSRVDATISSRLPTASYQPPLDASGTRAAIGLASANLDSQLDSLPTAAENASAVRTELATELGRIDVSTSSRSTFNPVTDTVANVTLVGTTTNLTNPPDVPTTGEIADAVRVELTPELDRIDTDVSSRLASASYTTPPTSVQNAQAVRTELSTELGRIDTSVSSRLASADYTVPPTALENAQAVEVQLALPLGNLDAAVSTRSTFNPATDVVAHVTLVDTATDLTNPPDVPTTSEIADAVRTELTPELSNLDATVSTRSTFNPTTDVVAHVTLVDTTTDLTNPPVVPTPEQIATAVREALEVELDRIDADITSRLASTDYTEPPTSEQNAEAVRTELTPELSRVENCATVATTGQQIQNALSS